MRKRFGRALLALLAGLVAAGGVQAAALRYALTPGTVRIGFRAYGLGMLPIDGGFTRFEGTLVLDDADPAACRMDVRAEAASLRMPQQAMTDDALGPDVLDVARFPEFRVDGRCVDGVLQAVLLLHGVSKPVAMAVSRTPGQWAATATIRRGEWGMGARPLLAGPEVRITLTAGLPR